MNKKFFAAALASALSLSSVAAFAATQSDITFDAWWTSHCPGIALSDDTVTVTFHDVNQGTTNWNNAIFVLYNGNGTVNGDGYAETAVFRLDNWGWDTNGGDTGDNYATLQANGITFTSSSTCNWDTFIADTQAGVDVTVTATNTSMTVVSSNGINYTCTYPSTSWLSLGGEYCTLSSINYTYASEATNTADATPVAYLAAATVIAGASVIAFRKRRA
ncbi:MAG: hypothetical protein K6F92_03270 [Lachnospiraceae bacterium]|nr:hypothetical protein [Lachnospiraceae bacterium]